MHENMCSISKIFQLLLLIVFTTSSVNYLFVLMFRFFVMLQIFKEFSTNKPKGLKVAKEDLRLIGLMVVRLDGR